MENEELPCYSIAQQDSSLSIFNSLFNQFRKNTLAIDIIILLNRR